MERIHFLAYIVGLKNQIIRFLQNCFNYVTALLLWLGLATPEYLDNHQRSQRGNIRRPHGRSIFTHSTAIMHELNAEGRIRDLLVGYVAAKQRHLTMEHVVCCSIVQEVMPVSKARQVELAHVATEAKIPCIMQILELTESFIALTEEVLYMLELQPSQKPVLQVQHFACDVFPLEEPFQCPIQSADLLKQLNNTLNKYIKQSNIQHVKH